MRDKSVCNSRRVHGSSSPSTKGFFYGVPLTHKYYMVRLSEFMASQQKHETLLQEAYFAHASNRFSYAIRVESMWAFSFRLNRPYSAR
jgi:hypothetical protein